VILHLQPHQPPRLPLEHLLEPLVHLASLQHTLRHLGLLGLFERVLGPGLQVLTRSRDELVKVELGHGEGRAIVRERKPCSGIERSILIFLHKAVVREVDR
jgi:hypothetical protein